MDTNTQRWIKDYSYYLKMERRMSPNTVTSYCSDISEFFDTTGVAPASADTDDILEYLGKRSDEVTKRTQARILSALRSFFDWLIMEGERTENPCDRVDSPKLGRYLPEVLSIEEVEAIMASVDTSQWTGLRDRAILEVLYGCGARVSEVTELKVSDIFAADGFIRIIGKGDKERIVPIGEIALEALDNYLAARPDPYDDPSGEYVFLNKNGKPLSRVAIFKMVKKQALLAGVTKEISPHTFRHSFATHLIENGADLRVVQEMLGHENILTTEIYTHIDSSTWQSAVLHHHPMGESSSDTDNND